MARRVRARVNDVRGAIYVSCLARAPTRSSRPRPRSRSCRRALGDVPLIGFYANGEIRTIGSYGYTGVLALF